MFELLTYSLESKELVTRFRFGEYRVDIAPVIFLKYTLSVSYCLN